MGADTFVNFRAGESAKATFDSIVSESRYENGHGGYSGTIAEKHSFVRVGTAATRKEAYDMADKMIEDGDRRIDDKWGPAGCIEVDEPHGFVFFGWASS